MYYSGNNIHILDPLDKDLKEKAEIIAQQLMAKENLRRDRAYMIAKALAKKYYELKEKGLF